uniref:Uncharacterized protein n=1 Tax=Panagrolaimus sp. JU765 TaxID=591449 RepID=A0AC34Q3M9_9BILA
MFNNYLPYGNAEVLFDSLLQYVINEDKLFCVAMEPFLHCKLPNGTTPDAIAEICDTKRQHHDSLHKDCHEYMTAYLVNRTWLLVVGIKYCLVIIVGIYATIRAIIGFKNRQHQKKPIIEPYQRPHSASAAFVTTRLIKSEITADNDSAVTL